MITRKTVLRGAGVALALPWLESMQAQASSRQSVKPPTRFGFLYFANGVHPKKWAPDGAPFSGTLKPLESLQGDILTFENLMNRNSIEGDGHYYKVAPILCGTAITKTTGRDVRSGGVSLDQLMAQHTGSATPLPSLELAVESPTAYVDTNVGLTTLYGSHVSWSTPTTPVTRELNPQLAFDRVFRNTTGASPIFGATDQSILDTVMADASGLRKRLGVDDRQKVDEYLDAVRSVEKRIAYDLARRKGSILDGGVLKSEVDTLGRRITDWYAVRSEKRGIDHTEQVRLMLDIMALGFWSDSTRVATFMFANEVSGRNFSFLPGVSGSHHELSHHENNEEKLAQYQRINVWHVEQYAYLLNRLKSFREGDGTVLDNSMVMFAGGMRDGNAHSPYNLPIVLGGRGGGSLQTGRHLKLPAQTPLCGLYVGLARRMGINIRSFGDASIELPGLGILPV
ncbi:MAG: DUF1552 domain-containing protein [Armatimonadaceae bacterium]